MKRGISSGELSASFAFLSQCPLRSAAAQINQLMAPKQTQPEPVTAAQTSLKSFDSMPGSKGLPLIGTLFDYIKKDGFRFNKIFEVRIS